LADSVAQVLVVDDDEQLRPLLVRALNEGGFQVSAAPHATSALDFLRQGKRFDAIVTDLFMPDMGGVDFLRALRRLDLDVPLIVMTGYPTLETAVATVRYGGFRYLDKPIELDMLVDTVREATSMHRLALLKRRALELYEAEGWLLGDRASIEAHFDRALDKLWLAFQPIVDWSTQSVYGYEALVRSAEPTLSNPGLLFDAAERLGRVRELGRRIRRILANDALRAPEGAVLFTNLHAADLNDEDLFSAEAPMTRWASRIVLEITERSSLDRVTDVRGAISSLRERGFRIAVDDLGAGYAGLSSFSQLEPDIAKLDMSLVRGIDQSPRKASIVRSMISVCTQELGTLLVCEGVETEAERDTLLDLGADLLQGYLLGRPEAQFRSSSTL
jgi:EAL domain-containing protein (putative c-di-GMP-specific phosphodiesterase class I)